MSRIRTIKPEFNTSRSVARLSEGAQLFMLKLLTECDDHGRIEWIPRKIVGVLYPHDPDKTKDDIDAYGQELSEEGILLFYKVGEDEFAHFPNWHDHQKVDRPSRSRLPDPPVDPCESREASMDTREDSSRNIRDTLAHSSTPEVGSRKEEVGNTTDAREGCTDPLETEVLGILRQVPGYARATGTRPHHLGEVFAEFHDVDANDWPQIAKALRDDALERPALKENSTFAASPAGDLRLFVPKWLRLRARGQPTPTRKPCGKPGLSDLREEALAVMRGEAA